MTNKHRPGSFRTWPILLALVALLAVAAESRAGQWHMKVQGIPGELTEGSLAGWTLVSDVSPIHERPVGEGVTVPIHFCKVKKSVDRTSPLLALRCATGQAIDQVTFTYIVVNNSPVVYRLTLRNVLVGAVSQKGPPSTGDKPEEEVELRFQKVEWSVLENDASGGNTGGLTARFDTLTGEGSTLTRGAFRAIVARNGQLPGVRVSWPGESGRTYRVFSCPSVGKPWQMLLEKTATEDGPISEFIPLNSPGLFMRVEEVE